MTLQSFFQFLVWQTNNKSQGGTYYDYLQARDILVGSWVLRGVSGFWFGLFVLVSLGYPIVNHGTSNRAILLLQGKKKQVKL